MRKRFLGLVLAMVLFILITPLAVQSTNAASKMTTGKRTSKGEEYAIFPIGGDFHVSQKWYEGSHVNQLAMDFLPLLSDGSAVDLSRTISAPFTGKIVETFPSWGCVIFQSNEPVQFANGIVDYMTVGFGHDNDSEHYTKNSTIKQGNFLCRPGTAIGYAWHTHIFVIQGTWADWCNGGYRSVGFSSANSGGGTIKPTEAFFLDTSFSDDWTQSNRSCYYPANKVDWVTLNESGTISATETCNHEYKTIRNSSGSYVAVCKNCGNEYRLGEINTADAGIYKTTAKIILNSAPYKESQVGNEIAKGTSFTVVGSVLNAYGNKWYQTKEGRWIYKDYLTRTGDLPASSDKLSISGANYPSHLDVGNIFIIYGTVSSERSNIKSLTVGVYDENGNEKTGKTVSPNARSYDIHKVDVDIRFDWLTGGTYYYRITATNSSETVRLLNQKFTVGSGSLHSGVTSADIPSGMVLLKERSLDNINGGRPHNGLVVFTNSGTIVGTNQYGNEIAVNSSGKIISVREYDNTKQLTVPNGGFVLSGHTYDANSGGDFVWSIVELKDARVVVDFDANKVKVYGYISVPTAATIAEGFYTLTPACAPNMRLDVSGSDKGANVWIWTANGSDPQTFRLTGTDSGYYAITSKYSGMVLDAWGASSASGTNVAQHPAADYFNASSGINQQWKLVDAGGGYYEIISRMSDSACLDVNGAGNTEQTNVQIWERNGSDAQKWKLTPVTVPIAVAGDNGSPVKLESTAYSDCTIMLNWNQSGWFGYWLRRAKSPSGPWSLLAELSGEVTSWTDNDISPSTRYYYALQPFTSKGEGRDYSNTSECVSSMVITAASTDSGIKLSWGKTCESGCWIRKSTSKNGSWTTVQEISEPNVETWLDTDVLPNTIYYYYIQPYNSSRVGGVHSNTVSVEYKKQEAQSKPAKNVSLPRQTVYPLGKFTDVPMNQWFYSGVVSAYEFGMMKGNSAATFNPYGDVTISEAITMAARIHNIYTNGSETIRAAGMGEQWYQPYLDYAYENGVIRYAYYNCDVSQKATRAQFAEIFALALPDEALAALNSVGDNAIPDVSASDSYAAYVYKLYRAGVLAGSDANGTFHPATFITRAEAATIVSRMASSDNRVSLTLN